MPVPSKGHGGQVGPPIMSRLLELSPMDFYKRGACRALYWEGYDFYPNMDDLDAVAEAKSVCQTCPVRVACLAWALKNKQEFGIWGGKTPWERGVK